MANSTSSGSSGVAQDRPLNIVVVGGGSAGWLSAAVIAAEHQVGRTVNISLIESSDIPTVGVGEGTWPSMRDTLKNIGISETDLIRECDVSFKQGSEFVGWHKGQGESYSHPFTLPVGQGSKAVLPLVLNQQEISFADAVCAQSSVCELNKAPKDMTSPEYRGYLNYAYHLDAGKFASLLKKHAIDTLGVRHIVATVENVIADETNHICSVKTKENGSIEGDFFIDCTGMKSLIIGEHYGIGVQEVGDVLGNDRALAIHVPYVNQDDDIVSHTKGTAQKNGWIWDIGLPSRRGVGHVFSSRYCDEDVARDALGQYVATLNPEINAQKDARLIKFTPGYRKQFWKNNCVAIGMASGFIEPLEASALVMIELASKFIAQQLPKNREMLPLLEKRFNQRFTQHWRSIIHFLKLHYVLSEREDSDYWRDHRDPLSVPDELKENLKIWQHQVPAAHDSLYAESLFPSASMQYVLYGMGFKTKMEERRSMEKDQQLAMKLLKENQQLTQQLKQRLPTNREILSRIAKYGLQKV